MSVGADCRAAQPGNLDLRGYERSLSKAIIQWFYSVVVVG